MRSEINASEGGKLSKRAKSGKITVIPAKAGIHIPAYAGIHWPITPMPEKNTPSFPKTLRQSREGGNPHSRARGNSLTHYPNAREKHSVIPKNTASFPRRRESTFPRTREFIGPLPRCLRRMLRHSQKHCVIPAKAGIHIPAHAGIH